MHRDVQSPSSRARDTIPVIRSVSLGGFLLLALVVTRSAGAQDVFGASDFTDAYTVPADPVVNALRCAENATTVVGWVLDATPLEDQRIEVSTHERDDCADGSMIEMVEDRGASREGTVDVPAQAILPDCPAVDSEERFICVLLTSVAGTDDSLAVAIEVLVDTVAPDPPDDISVSAADSALNVSWDWDARPGDLGEVRVLYRPAEDTGDPSSITATGAAVSSARISDLVNGVTYELWVEPVDEAGNVGDASESVLGTPQATKGFWEIYRERGGAEIGGCGIASRGSSSFAFLALIMLLPLALLRGGPGRYLRLGRVKMLVVPVVATAVSLPAASQAFDSALIKSQDDGRPDSNWFIELDLGPYRPEVDREFDDDGPYTEVFGDGSELMVRLRVERALLQGVGQLGTGLSVGFAQAAGRAFFADETPSPDYSVFNWVPLQLSLTYRLDYPALEWGVPLVPYVRGGLASTLWWVYDPEGVEVDADGNRAIGMRHGFFYAGGLKFLINVLDPRLAADLRRSVGVEHTYLFGEVSRMEVDGFGQPGLNLSDTTWAAGLAVEF